MVEAKTEEKKSTLTEKQKNLLDRVKNKAHLIGHLVGFHKLNELHAEWIRNFWKKRRTTYVLKSHRGSYKSTAITLFIALIVIFKPNETVIFLRKTDNDVKEIISNVSKILKTDVFQAFSQIMYGHGYRLTKDTAFEVSTSLKTGLGGGSQVLGIGIKGSLTGKHADWIIVDDIANRKDKDSHAEREFTKAVWQELQNVKNPEGRSIAIGTVWHPDDVFSLMPKADIYTCYETGLLTNDQIEEIKHTMTPSLFAANYELKFIADEDAIFTDYQTLYDKDLENGLNNSDIEYGVVLNDENEKYDIMSIGFENKNGKFVEYPTNVEYLVQSYTTQDAQFEEVKKGEVRRKMNIWLENNYKSNYKI